MGEKMRWIVLNTKMLLLATWMASPTVWGGIFVEIPWNLGQGTAFQEKKIESYYSSCIKDLFVQGVATINSSVSGWADPTMQWSMKDRRRLVFFKHIDQTQKVIYTNAEMHRMETNVPGYKTVLLKDGEFSKLLEGSYPIPKEYLMPDQTNTTYRISAKIIASIEAPQSKELTSLGIQLPQEDIRYDHFIVVRDRFYFDVLDARNKKSVVVAGDVVLRQIVVKKTEGNHKNAFAWGLYCEFDNHEIENYQDYLETILGREFNMAGADTWLGYQLKNLNKYPKSFTINHEVVDRHISSGGGIHGFDDHFFDPQKVVDQSSETLAVLDKNGAILAEKTISEDNSKNWSFSYYLSERIRSQVATALHTNMFVIDSSVDLSRMKKTPF